ncbi:DUF3298 domain-containing protein [uncultured Devosia sp.]|uniref:DUF3298 domain-containing protein n=1 Tax=uncultured Devosia sp. TaxID=211434 RepID=UPI0035C998A9
MVRTMLGAVLMLVALVLAPQAQAASFDCAAATTAFEHAICDNPALSSADETLAQAFATATGGLSKPAVSNMRADQRAWLDFAARSCTDDAELLPDDVRYDAEQVECLASAAAARISVLEDSRMLGGHRFALSSRFATLPDPDAANQPDYYWKVASHTVSFPQLEGDDGLATSFNAFVDTAVTTLSGTLTDTDGDAPAADAQSDSDLTISPLEALPRRITLKAQSDWFGHGGAHGNGTVSYLHFLTDEGRALEASDVFSGEGWAQKLLELSVAELKKEHGDWLMLDADQDIADVVTQPDRWSFSSPYGLTIQFQPYEVAAYAYGAPTILIPWESLDGMTAPSLDTVRYGS